MKTVFCFSFIVTLFVIFVLCVVGVSSTKISQIQENELEEVVYMQPSLRQYVDDCRGNDGYINQNEYKQIMGVYQTRNK